MPAVLLVAMLRLPSPTFTTRFPPTQAYMAQFPAILRTVYTSSGPSSPDRFSSFWSILDTRAVAGRPSAHSQV